MFQNAKLDYAGFSRRFRQLKSDLTELKSELREATRSRVNRVRMCSPTIGARQGAGPFMLTRQDCYRSLLGLTMAFSDRAKGLLSD